MGYPFKTADHPTRGKHASHAHVGQIDPASNGHPHEIRAQLNQLTEIVIHDIQPAPPHLQVHQAPAQPRIPAHPLQDPRRSAGFRCNNNQLRSVI
ncbi:hypothetical protein TWF192_001912 [Orbilia oligospora]|nr:hypothetical protein TWF192_001912 [Orbilia oligospora]